MVLGSIRMKLKAESHAFFPSSLFTYFKAMTKIENELIYLGIVSRSIKDRRSETRKEY